MNSRTKTLLQELYNLSEHFRRELEETRAYCERCDLATAVRNLEASDDELNTFVNKWRELKKELKEQL